MRGCKFWEHHMSLLVQLGRTDILTQKTSELNLQMNTKVVSRVSIFQLVLMYLYPIHELRVMANLVQTTGSEKTATETLQFSQSKLQFRPIKTQNQVFDRQPKLKPMIQDFHIVLICHDPIIEPEVKRKPTRPWILKSATTPLKQSEHNFIFLVPTAPISLWQKR